MNIQFDDGITQPQAQGLILLLQSLFPALNNSQPVSPSVPPVPTTEAQAIAGVPIPIQATPADAPIPAAGPGSVSNAAFQAVDKLVSIQNAVLESSATQAGPTPVQPEPAARKRRTKAQIEADEAAAKQASTPAAEPVKGSLNVSEAGDIETSTPAPTSKFTLTIEPVKVAAADTSPTATQYEVTATREAVTASEPTPTKPITSVPMNEKERKALLNDLFNEYIAAHSFEAAYDILREFDCIRVNEAVALEPAKLSALVARLQTDSAPSAYVTVEPVIVEPVIVEPVTKDQLKVIVQGYLTRHTEKEAVAILRSFGCGLVSEAMALPADKLSELVSKFNG